MQLVGDEPALVKGIVPWAASSLEETPASCAGPGRPTTANATPSTSAATGAKGVTALVTCSFVSSPRAWPRTKWR